MNFNGRIPIIHQLFYQIYKETYHQIPILKYFFYDVTSSDLVHQGNLNKDWTEGKKSYVFDYDFYYYDKKMNSNLLICYSDEIGFNYNNDISESISFIKSKFDNYERFLFIVGGQYENIPENYKSIIYPKSNLSWLQKVFNFNQEINYENCLSRPFLFDALLGSKKTVRMKIFNFLENHNLLNQSLVTLKDNTWNNSKEVNDYVSPSLYDLERTEIQDFKNNWNEFTTYDSYMKVVDSEQYWSHMNCVTSPKIYQNSWFSIISESNFYSMTQKFNFITEKTAKCIFGKRIFVCFALPNHLKYIRDLGFKTFDGIIDESYDQETDDEKRFNMVCEQILWLSKQDPINLYQKTQPILEYNFNKALNFQFDKKGIKEFIKSHLS